MLPHTSSSDETSITHGTSLPLPHAHGLCKHVS
jgi:hypothetical protein